MLAPGKDLVFALLMLDLKRWSVRIKSHLVVNLPIRGIPGCCPRQIVAVESVGKSEPVVLCEPS